MSELIVDARSIHKTYETGRVRVDALKGVDLTVARGEMLAIMGPSGCGKTTLLNCLSGLDDVDAGEIVIEGVALSTMTDRQRTDYRARRMGFVFQFYNLMPVLTAVENVELPLLVARVRAAQARRRALESLDLVGIADRAAHLPDELSGGERQRVTLARAVVGRPAVVLADEPTGNLDSATGAQLLDLLVGLADDHTAVVVVTHDPTVAARAGRVVRVVDGRVVTDTRTDPEAAP
jgi:putative ABC transport system ATP-binding protein